MWPFKKQQELITPTFTPPGGSYPSAQSVTLFVDHVGASIRYTTDGSTPTNNSPLYTSPISVTKNTTIKAFSTEAGFTNSPIVSTTYAIAVATQELVTPVFTPAAGTFASTQFVTISVDHIGAVARYTVDGSIPTNASPIYTSPILISGTTTIKAIATEAGYLNSPVVSATYVDSAPPPPPAPPTGGFSDNFSTGTLDASLWQISDYQAPGDGVFKPSAISLTPGMLALHLTQDATSSVGGEIQSIKTYGYGTYSWTFRAGSTASAPNVTGTVVSGSISSGFTYVNNSQTEIDFEDQGQYPTRLDITNWSTVNAKQTSNVSAANLGDAFHVYKMVWSATQIQYFLDGVLVGTHTQNIPSAPAYVMINFWGTNSTDWGGLRTPGVDRWMYVSQFTFIPA